MDKEIFAEFTKSALIGTAQIVAFIAGIFLAVNVAIWVGVDAEAAVPVVMIGILAVMMIWFGLSRAWDSAKSKVEYKRKWGEDL